MQNYWKGKKVLVTGGSGFIGSYVVELLLEHGAKVSITTIGDHLKNIDHLKGSVEIIRADLRNAKDATRATKGKEIVLNLASRVAGIVYNNEHPVIMFNENVEISKNVIEAAHAGGVSRFLVTSSACVYPRNCTIPTPEAEGFLDDPEPSNLGYGWAKRVAELQGKFYNLEYGMEVAIARPYNAYGPRDNFDPAISHVIPGIIKRVFDGENPLVVWGSGKQTRSFLYAEDFARGLLAVTEKHAVCDPLNIGTSEEVTIGDLARLIVGISGKKTEIIFDTSKPDGQPRRNCDTKKAFEKTGFRAQVPLEEGLKRTIEWYRKQA
ncbi:MAG: NAD-dependent epimerase/dehydratase family protein [Candidatus Curtissbacteria bacterium]